MLFRFSAGLLLIALLVSAPVGCGGAKPEVTYNKIPEGAPPPKVAGGVQPSAPSLPTAPAAVDK